MSLDWAELMLRLAHHIRLTGVSLAAGVAISIPLAAACVRWGWLRGPVLGAVSIVQTVPSLALLALMVVISGSIGFWPAVVALTAYSLLPIVRNAVTGLESVDPDSLEAARGIGMTWLQTLLRVRLPLAMPVIVAGLRTATVWVVGMAVLATPVGEVSLGNYIFSGLQLSNNAMVLTGVVAAVALVMVLDGLVRLVEWTSSVRRWRLSALGTLALAGVLVGGTAPLWGIASGDQRTVVIGAKTFSEQYILAHAIEDILQDAGFSTSLKPGLGSTVAFEALASGEIDVYVDYSGTIWANQMKREDIVDREQTLALATDWLRDDRAVTNAGPLGFENAYVFVTRPEIADRLDTRSIGSLAPFDDTLTLGGDYEFFERPEWERLRSTYALGFERLVSMDASLMYQACRAGEVDVITAFGTDGRIAAFDLVSLRDDAGAFPPYDAVLLLSPNSGDLVRTLAPLINTVPIETMREANRRVDMDGDSPENVAEWLLTTIDVKN